MDDVGPDIQGVGEPGERPAALRGDDDVEPADGVPGALPESVWAPSSTC